MCPDGLALSSIRLTMKSWQLRLTEAWRLIAPNDFNASLVCPAGNSDNGAKLPNIARVETFFVYALSAGENGR